jgi:hypothetical protein
MNAGSGERCNRCLGLILPRLLFEHFLPVPE